MHGDDLTNTPHIFKIARLPTGSRSARHWLTQNEPGEQFLDLIRLAGHNHEIVAINGTKHCPFTRKDQARTNLQDRLEFRGIALSVIYVAAPRDVSVPIHWIRIDPDSAARKHVIDQKEGKPHLSPIAHSAEILANDLLRLIPSS